MYIYIHSFLDSLKIQNASQIYVSYLHRHHVNLLCNHSNFSICAAEVSTVCGLFYSFGLYVCPEASVLF